MSRVARTKLKQCEKPLECKAKILSKISCKIGNHFVYAFINSGSSVSIASTDLYRKLLNDKCPFDDRKGNFHEIDDSIPNEEYRIASVTVHVIGQTKEINLVALPNCFIKKTTLGMDFLASKTISKPILHEVSQEPHDTVQTPPQKAVKFQGNDEKNEPIPLFDWIMNPDNLKKPLYNILSEETADDEDLFAICAYMKRLPRPVSPIRSLKKPRDKKLHDVELVNTSVDNVPMLPFVSSNSNKNVCSEGGD